MSTVIGMLLRDKLKELMREAGDGTNVSSAGRRVGVPATTLRDILRGSTPGYDTAVKIAKGFDVPLDWLLDDAADFSGSTLNGDGGSLPPDHILRVEQHLDHLSNPEELRRGLNPTVSATGRIRAAINRAESIGYTKAELYVVLRWAATEIATLEGRITELQRQLADSRGSSSS